MDESMELGETGWIYIGDGWFENKVTGRKQDSQGNEYDADGKPIKKDKDES